MSIIYPYIQACAIVMFAGTNMMTILLEVVVLTLLLSIPAGMAVPLSSFYSFGSGANDTLLPPNDDGSSPNISLPAPFLFFGTYYSTIFVSYTAPA